MVSLIKFINQLSAVQIVQLVFNLITTRESINRNSVAQHTIFMSPKRQLPSTCAKIKKRLSGYRSIFVTAMLVDATSKPFAVAPQTMASMVKNLYELKPGTPLLD